MSNIRFSKNAIYIKIIICIFLNFQHIYTELPTSYIVSVENKAKALNGMSLDIRITFFHKHVLKYLL